MGLRDRLLDYVAKVFMPVPDHPARGGMTGEATPSDGEGEEAGDGAEAEPGDGAEAEPGDAEKRDGSRRPGNGTDDGA